MATPQSMMHEQTDIQTSSSRLVWVLNRDFTPYKGTFRGIKIEIPGNMKKIPKPASEGGNLMPYLEARRFIVDYKEPQGYEMDNMGKPQPIFGVKALIDQELTQEEFASIVKKTPAEIKKEILNEERAAKANLTKSLNKNKSKVAYVEEEEKAPE
jgi:hypothetical protein